MLMATSSLPEWLYPGPADGWTADDLDALPPEAPRRVELIDGALIIMSPQTLFHQFMVNYLLGAIRPPGDLKVVREMDLKISTRQRPVPDVMVVTASSTANLDRTSFTPDDVRLVVEVVSPESEDRDRETRPAKYAKAGIRFLWRVEREGSTPVAYTYELDPASGAYVATGVHRGRLKTDIGFPVDVDLAIRA
jgi:Uma2 family endonuclease